MRFRLYVDEDAPLAFAVALLNRGVNVLTTQEAGNVGKSDVEQLVFAIKEERAFFTHNKKDFVLLHKEYHSAGKGHPRIILSNRLPVGVLLRRVMRLWFSLSREEMKDRLEFLSSWK